MSDASDVYSLGLLMVNALRGRPIDMDGTQVEVIEKRRSVPDISDIDPSLQPIINLMLQPNPADRDVSMLDISHWLAEGKLTSAPIRQMPTMPQAANLEVAPTAEVSGSGISAGRVDEDRGQTVKSDFADAGTSIGAAAVFPASEANAQGLGSVADSILPLSAPVQQTLADAPPKEVSSARVGSRSGLIAASLLLLLTAGGVAGGVVDGLFAATPSGKDPGGRCAGFDAVRKDRGKSASKD